MSERKIKASANNLVCICVNASENGNYSGTLYNKYQKEGIEFDQLDQVIMPIEELLNELQSPRAAQKSRVFIKNGEPKSKISIDKEVIEWSDDDFMEIKGNIATFYVFVRYRQNSTWQGEIYWKEQNVRAEFSSELDMLKLIDTTIDSI